MTLYMMQNSHEIREFVWLYDRIDIMESMDRRIRKLEIWGRAQRKAARGVR